MGTPSLAQSIKASQTRENTQMRRWYRTWLGRDVPSWGLGTGWGWQNGMGMGPMSGGTNHWALREAPDFDRAFIEQMIPHHQMGVRMASMAQTNAQHPELPRLEQWYRKGGIREGAPGGPDPLPNAP